MNLPVVADAKLPAVYEAAKTALAECARVDECQRWADKAEAMASYAKQANDDTLRKTADKIQARAIRRCGELLKEIDSGAGKPKSNGGGAPTITRSKAARDAGLSRDQKVTALRVANVPGGLFEDLVESDWPPTVTELAELGTKSKPKPIVDLKGRDPAEFRSSMSGQGWIRSLAEFGKANKPGVVARGALPHEFAELEQNARSASKWITSLLDELERCKED